MGGPWELYQDDSPSQNPPKGGPWELYRDNNSMPEGPKQSDDEPGLLSSLGGLALKGSKEAGKLGLEVAGKVGNFVDSYTGAPTRSAIYAAQNGENPIKAGWNQLGGDAEKAPTGKDIAKKAGVTSETPLSSKVPGFAEKGSNHPWYQPEKGGLLDATPSGTAGTAIDLAANPLNLVFDSGALSKVLQKAGKIKPALEDMALKAAMSQKLSSAEKLAESGKVYDPFVKAIRDEGMSTDEIANIGNKFEQPVGEPTLKSKAGDLALRALDAGDKSVEAIQKAYPYVMAAGEKALPWAARGAGYLLGHVPGAVGAEALVRMAESKKGQKVIKAILDKTKSVGQTAASNPGKTQLLLKSIDDEEKE